MSNRLMSGVVITMLAMAGTACRSETPAEESHEGHAGGRVYFVTPKDGDTIKPMSTFQFAHEGLTIGAVPPGELTPEQVRPGITHYHLGVDTDCLPAGTIIPKADPWIHFGDGKNEIEMALPPGPHKLVLQSGDDMHRTLDGLCETINVTVAP
ncbi:MAG TPA: DUF4399 domain-containing protein [Vicinamibacterales bacterium]|nr:DUF4399 domain-containing protein [Vicinamibacterales bacterium]